MRLLAFFVAIILAAYAQTKLLFLMTIHRHGARAASRLYKPGFWEVGKNELTNNGKTQLLELGREYRRRYVLNESEEIRGFLPKRLEQSALKDIWVLSSPSNRTLESFENLLEGLFEDTNPADLHRVKVKTPEEIINHHNLKEKRKDLTVYVAEEEKDYFFHAHDASVCPQVGERQNSLNKSKNFSDAMKTFKKKFGQVLATEINDKWGTKLNPSKMSIRDVLSSLDLIMTTEAEKGSGHIFNFSDALKKEIKKAKRAYVYEWKFGDETVVKITNNYLFKLLRFLLIKRFLLSKPSPKWFEVSAHDRNIAALIKALLTSNELLSLPSELLDVPFASHVEIEIHEEHAGNMSVKVIYNWHELEMKKCRSPCSLTAFLELLANLTSEKDSAELCTSRGAGD